MPDYNFLNSLITMKRLWILLQIFTIAATQDEWNLDPCLNFKHLYEMEKRYVSYISDVDNGEAEICDRYLIPSTGEWYYSDEDMPVSAPPLFRCGTAFPIWLTGGIPVPADGIVNRTACLSGTFSDCDKTYNIRVKACGGFSVYFLVPSSGCPEAYCFGIGSSDPPPENGTQKPDVKHHIVKVETRDGVFQDRLEFECFIGEQGNLSYPFYQISWLRDGVSVYTRTEPVTNLNGLRLTEDRTKPVYFDSLGVTLSCISRAKNAEKGRAGPMMRSDNFFSGVVLEPETVELTRNESKTITFNMTVPFGCGWFDENTWRSCFLDVQMYVPDSNKCEGKITANENAKNCYFKIQRDDWNKQQSLQVKYQDRGTYNIETAETFIIQFITTNAFHPLWQNYLLPTVQVRMQDNLDKDWKGRTCSSQNDPHMTTFDGRHFENQNPGTYILYEHTDNFRPMQVQIKLRTCNRPGIYCNCGVAVRAGGDVFVIDFCHNNRVMQYITCHDKILDVRRNRKNSYIYNIFFPTGTEVQVNLYYSTNYKQYNLNVRVKASMHDTGSTKGLCGYLSGTCKDDFVKSDSSYSSTSGAREECRGQHFTSLYPNDFSVSWRVNNVDSLFELAENQQIGLWNDANRYCTCPDDPKLQPPSEFEFECDPASVTTCQRTIAYVEIGKGMCQVLSGLRKKSNIKISSVSYPWVSFRKHQKLKPKEKIELYSNVSMDFETALEYCRNTIGNTTAFTACSEVPNVPTEDALEICALDITLTNSFEWVEETLETLKAGCITELQKNDSLHVADGNGTELSIADQIGSMICPGLPACYGHGECLNGTCKCQQGYIDVDCSVNHSQPPELYGMRGEGMCDITEIACDTSFLVGNGMSFSPNLTCNIQDFVILQNGEKHYMTEYIVDGILETIVEVHCPVHRVNVSRRSRSLRENRTFIIGHSVSVSYDGINFGDKYDMFIYDSKCQNPDSASNSPKFSLLANTCFIEGRCLFDGDHNISNTCLICESASPFDWSIDSNSSECVLHIVKPKDHEDTDVMLIAGPIIGAVAGILVILSAAIIIRNCKNKSKNNWSEDDNWY